jgi:hypothetical protein
LRNRSGVVLQELAVESFFTVRHAPSETPDITRRCAPGDIRPRPFGSRNQRDRPLDAGPTGRDW